MYIYIYIYIGFSFQHFNAHTRVYFPVAAPFLVGVLDLRSCTLEHHQTYHFWGVNFHGLETWAQTLGPYNFERPR